VALDLRLFHSEEIGEIRERMTLSTAGPGGPRQKHLDVVMPGYTHLQPAQPVLFAHHLLAYYEDDDRVQHAS